MLYFKIPDHNVSHRSVAHHQPKFKKRLRVYISQLGSFLMALVTPEPSEQQFVLSGNGHRWFGAIKTLFWATIATTIGFFLGNHCC